MAVNFVAVPLVIAALFPFRPNDRALQLGALLVLLALCVDYVAVLPPALALPDSFGVAAVAIVTQTLVEGRLPFVGGPRPGSRRRAP